LKKEFWGLPGCIGWNLPGPQGLSAHTPSCSLPSEAMDGNFLEAINTALNLLDKHYMDR